MLRKKKNNQLDEMEEISAPEDEKSIFEEFESDEDKESKAPKKKKKLPGWVIIPIIAVILVIAVVGSKLAGGSKASLALDVVKVDKGDVKEIYNTSGIVESDQTKVFFSPVNAPISECSAKVGMSVKAGDQLVTFDTKDLEKNNKESQLNALSTQYTNQGTKEQAAKSGAEAAKAQNQTANKIASLKSQIADKETSIGQLKSNEASAAAAMQAMQAQKHQLQSEVDSLSSEVDGLQTANANLEDANKYVNENHPDYTQEQKDKLVSDNNTAITENRNKIKGLNDKLRAKKGELDGMGDIASGDAGSMAAAAEQELQGLRAQLKELQGSDTSGPDSSLTAGQVKGMQVSENLTELASLSAEELLAKGREGIKAEFDGVISDVKAGQTGEAAQGMELFTLVSNQSVGVKLEVSSSDFDKLKIGSKASIKVGENTYQGTLQSIDKIAVKNEKGNPVIGAKVHIDNPDENIYIGVASKVAMTVAEEENVLNIPSEAVNASSAGDFVYIIKDGVVKKQIVEIGVASNNKVQVTSGLKEGDQVITDTSVTVKEGMKASAKMNKGSK